MIQTTFSALLFDLDGTLICANQKPCLAGVAAIRQAAELLPVAIVSGRYHAYVKEIANSLGLKTPQISENGARLFDPISGRTLESRPLSNVATDKIIGLIRERGEQFMICNQASTMDAVSPTISQPLTVITAEVGTLENGLALIDKVQLLELPVQCAVSRGAQGEWYAVFNAHGVDKGLGAKLFAQHTQTDLSSMLAIGDGPNDVPLFRTVGTAVAMGNAISAARESATEHTDICENQGLAKAVRRLILNAA